MNNTTHPKIRPKPIARLGSGSFAVSTREPVSAGSPEDEVGLDGKDVDEPDADVMVVGSILPKKDEAMEDIFGFAAARTPLHSLKIDCLSSFSFSVHLYLKVSLLTL